MNIRATIAAAAAVQLLITAYEADMIVDFGVVGGLTREQFDAEMRLGMADIAAGRVLPAEDVEAEMRRQYGV